MSKSKRSDLKEKMLPRLPNQRVLEEDCAQKKTVKSKERSTSSDPNDWRPCHGPHPSD